MFESKINRGRANGYAPLDGDGKVPLSKLPPIQSTIDTSSLVTMGQTGSFATTGSNTFTGVQTLAGTSGTGGQYVGLAELTIGQAPIIGQEGFGIRASGFGGVGLALTSDDIFVAGMSKDSDGSGNDGYAIINAQTYYWPFSYGPTVSIATHNSGSEFGKYWVYENNGISYIPGDVNIGYDVAIIPTTSGSLNIRDGNINVSGSVNINSGSLNITKGNINVSGSLYFGSGSVISETSSSTIITPPGAGAGQSLVIRPTLSTWATTASAFIVYGEPITVAIISIPNRDYNGNYFGTLNYEISGSGVTQQSLGRPLTGSFVFNPGNSEKSITWTIPANSTISEFTLTIVSLDGTYTGYESGETDPALYYNFEENGLPIGQYITVTNNGIFNSEHSHIHLVSGDPSLVDIYLGDDDQYVKIEKDGGDVVIGTNLDTHHWRFDTSGSLILPNDMVIDASVDFGILQIGGDGTYIRIDDGGAPPSLTIATNGGENDWVFDLDGNLTTPGDINVGGNINGVDNLVTTSSFNEYTSSLTTSFPSKTIGTWTIPNGASTQSFTVDPNSSYTMWVNGNIPNGIITWNATATISNTNVPVLGAQYGWYYTAGNALVLTTMPDQFVGTNGTISTSPGSYAPNTSNVFKFGITNNSGTTQSINYGYIKLS
jgi:hypothetical protein